MNYLQLSVKDYLPITFIAITVLMMSCMRPSAGDESNTGTLQMFDNNYVITEAGVSGFPLVEEGKAATVIYDSSDEAGLPRILSYFSKDVEMVSGVRPTVLADEVPVGKHLVIVGSLEKSSLIKKLIEAGKLDVAEIKGKWENSLIEVVQNPFEGVESALVVTGSDKRGVYYGLFDISRQMGVSPWYWWADVPVDQHEHIFIKEGRFDLGEPKVKYRGIFLNDEEPALGRWAVEKYGGFNHQFYEKVFELMLRLKGNYMWPAMWWASFNTDDPMNRQLAHEMGIVMGTSHHEPMDRAHAEWKAKTDKGAWNYESNAEELRQFWREGIERIGEREVVINMGMRGDGDMAMSEETNIALLERIVADQRKIIEEVRGEAKVKTPQMWALYKEVQEYYDKGMRVPDDVTLLLCDDNWGNIRKLPKPGSAIRSGGYGIYYHFDYVGGPRSYKWLNTSPIPRVWEQMNLAYQHGVKELWLVNVGDLKPMEYPITFWLDFAWNPEKISANDLEQYAINWSGEQFGAENAALIAEFMKKYTKFNGRRKPELLEPGTYSLVHFNEAQNYVKEYTQLYTEAYVLGKKLPEKYADAYYQLVLHPIEACSNLNEMYVAAAKNRYYAKQGRATANTYADKVKALFDRDAAITQYYHTELAGGKWNNMMNQTHIGYTYWQQPDKNYMPEVKTIRLPNEAAMGLSVSGSERWIPGEGGRAVLPEFDCFNRQQYTIEVFNRGAMPFNFTVKADDGWIKLNPGSGEVKEQSEVIVTIDWAAAPKGTVNSLIEVSDDQGNTLPVLATVYNPADDELNAMKGFVESNGYIAIEAPNFSRNTNGSNAQWELIPGLGRTLGAMHPVPVNLLPDYASDLDQAVLEYDVFTRNSGVYELKTHLSPTLNIYNDEGLEFAVSIDDQEPVVLNMHEKFSFRDGEEALRNNTLYTGCKLTIDTPGNHTLKVWMIDPGVVIQKLVLSNSDYNKYTYLGPPESARVQ
ncbi:glycosyl hydrolase 115 family protein [Roseimarinus sediminis]|uniref:glycosyl hydrolase 115 family protein n=1 Tax=Roseimarinus sediminis TaxID=1610899 RepID=UPI003D1DD7F4